MLVLRFLQPLYNLLVGGGFMALGVVATRTALADNTIAWVTQESRTELTLGYLMIGAIFLSSGSYLAALCLQCCLPAGARKSVRFQRHAALWQWAVTLILGIYALLPGLDGPVRFASWITCGIALLIAIFSTTLAGVAHLSVIGTNRSHNPV